MPEGAGGPKYQMVLLYAYAWRSIEHFVIEQRATEAIGDAVRRFVNNNTLRNKEFHSAIRYAKSLNRSVIGSMNDLIFGARFMIDGGIDLQEAADRLNETPLKALTSPDGRRYAKPNEVFRRIIEEV